jgi:hypothetical protein
MISYRKTWSLNPSPPLYRTLNGFSYSTAHPPRYSDYGWERYFNMISVLLIMIMERILMIGLLKVLEYQ